MLLAEPDFTIDRLGVPKTMAQTLIETLTNIFLAVQTVLVNSLSGWTSVASFLTPAGVPTSANNGLGVFLFVVSVVFITARVSKNRRKFGIVILISGVIILLIGMILQFIFGMSLV